MIVLRRVNLWIIGKSKSEMITSKLV